MNKDNTALASQHCNELLASDVTLDQQQLAALLLQLNPKWQLDTEQQTIHCLYRFNNYYQTIAFVNVIAQIAHQQNHHPDLRVGYKQCTVIFRTHRIGGLSINDFICAAKINAAQNL